ncbi:MAG: Gfo/Idh/MocA family oxidoreductase, partial [Bacteroidota bacterium]
ERTRQLSKEKYPDVIIYRSLEELLTDEEVELMIVNTPNYTHYDYTKKALLANKNVIVEKPFTTTSDEAAELIDIASQKGKLITVFHNRRFDSDFKTVQKVVKDGVLGEIVDVEIHFDRFKEELSPKTHKEVPGEATGSLYDLGSHLIDQALQLFGKPQSVFADVRIVRPISKVDDYFEVVLYYPYLRVKLKSSYLVREALPAFILHGSFGSFIKSRADVQEMSLQAGNIPGTLDWGRESEMEQGILHTMINGKVIRERIPTLQGNYLDFFEGVFNALRNQTPVPVPVEDALEVVKIIELAHKSSKERKVIKM